MEASAAALDDSRKLKLLYFNIAGKGEPIRLLCHAAGLALEDYRFADRAEFTALKTSGALQFGQVPCLHVDGGKTQLVQSAAIMRFVARIAAPGKDHLWRGLSAEAAAKVDALMDQEADAFLGLRVAKYRARFGFGEDVMTEQNVASVTARINSEILPRHLGFLEAILKAGGTGWLAGTAQPTIADYFWVPSLKAVESGWAGDPEILKAFPGLTALMARFAALPDVQAYYASRA
jgi:glutathione S-transferase